MTGLTRIGFWLGMLAVLVVVAGCAEVRVRMGSEIDPSNIESVLQVGRSKQADVRQVFGPPDGIGAYVSPVNGDFSTMWSYYFAEGTLNVLNDTMLFVYFDGDVYTGYLWFENTLAKEGGK